MYKFKVIRLKCAAVFEPKFTLRAFCEMQTEFMTIPRMTIWDLEQYSEKVSDASAIGSFMRIILRSVLAEKPYEVMDRKDIIAKQVCFTVIFVELIHCRTGTRSALARTRFDPVPIL